MTIDAFEIDVPQATLDDLAARLAQTRWPAEVTGTGWDYGTNRAYLQELAAYWRDGFDWRAQEAAINRFAHFRTEVDGFGIHFIHEQGKGPDPIPIVLTHGWPDSFYRMQKIIPMLTDPVAHGSNPADSFDVIVPSLPGYGFSDKPTERGMTASRVAGLWARLMTEGLGYHRFAAHGGDIGSSVTQELALSYPELLIGIHLTDVPYLNLVRAAGNMTDLSNAEQAYFAAGQAWGQQEGAYAMVQATKPLTLAYGLNDSPIGLAAWIVEKFRAWSDCDGDVERRFSRDELLTNLMVYWVTETIGSSFLIYYEWMHHPPTMNAGERAHVPAAFAMFPKDIVPAPREFAERFFQVERWTEMPRGGHFAAMEEPELLMDDIRATFRPWR